MRKMALLAACLLLAGTQAYGANGDLTVDGNLKVGTTVSPTTTNATGNIFWGGTIKPYAYSGQDGLGLFFEQVGDAANDSRIRLQSSNNGDGQNYSQFYIDPLNGFSFMALGGGNGNVGIGTTIPKGRLGGRL